MTDLERAKTDPASIYHSPRDVLCDASLTRHDKIDILRRWAYDEREIAVAEEENMTHANADARNLLDEILRCLIELGVDSDQDSPPPTKQG